MEKLTHFNEKGQSRMVDVTQKDETIRIAVAAGKVLAKLETLHMVESQQMLVEDAAEKKLAT